MAKREFHCRSFTLSSDEEVLSYQASTFSYNIEVFWLMAEG
jgi:hypothetical protein